MVFYVKPTLLQDKGLTICAFHNCRVRLVCTDANVVKCAIFAVCTGTVKLTCVYTAADRFVHLLHTHAITSFSFFVFRLAFAGVYRACEVIVCRSAEDIRRDTWQYMEKSLPLVYVGKHSSVPQVFDAREITVRIGNIFSEV